MNSNVHVVGNVQHINARGEDLHNFISFFSDTTRHLHKQYSKHEFSEQMAYIKLAYVSGNDGPNINPFASDAPDRSILVPTATDTHIRIIRNEDIEEQYNRDRESEAIQEQSGMHVCEAGCECHVEEHTQQAEADLQDGQARINNFVKRSGIYVSVPEHGIKHGIELTATPDTIVPGTSMTFRRRHLLKSLRWRACAARWQMPLDDPEAQRLINEEHLSEDQLNILLAPSRAALAAMQEVEQDANLDPNIGFEAEPSAAEKGVDDSRVETLEEKVRQALDNFKAMPDDIRPSNIDLEAFVTLIYKYEHLFQQDFHNNMEPAVMAPMKVKIRTGAKFSYRQQMTLRPYSERHSIFMEKQLKKMERQGLIRRTTDPNVILSPVLIVDKPGAAPGVYRLVVDLKYVNSITEPGNMVLPVLQDELIKTRGMRFFLTVDFLSGFFQCPLDPESQWMYTMLTPYGNYTFTRTPQGASACPGHFHTEVAKIFSPLMDRKVAMLWIDDLLLMAKTWSEFMANLTEMLELASKHRLVLSVKKCELGAAYAKWCGRIFDGQTITMDARCSEAFEKMATPTYAGELSTFLHGMDWMSGGLLRWAEHSAPLRDFLGTIKQSCIPRGKVTTKKRNYEKIKLTAAGWDENLQRAFEVCKQVLVNRLHQTIFDPNDKSVTICLFTDASDTHWAGFLTQVRNYDPDKPVYEQQHEPLGTLSGAFSGAQLNWSVIEKESYPILKMLGQFDHILSAPKGFKVFCDHANIVSLFHPEAQSPSLAKQTVDKVYRWLFHLGTYRVLSMEHLAGQHNVWADMLSRSAHPTYYKIKRMRLCPVRAAAAGEPDVGVAPQPVHPVRHFKNEYLSLDFDPLGANHTLPDKGEILNAQRGNQLGRGDKRWLREARSKGIIDDHRVINDNGETDGVIYIKSEVDGEEHFRAWIPRENKTIVSRFLVAAHCGRDGHLSATETLKYLKRHVFWDGMDEEVKRFCIEDCLCCLKTQHTSTPRPFASQLHATERGQVVHFDFMYIGKPPQGYAHEFVYVLVIKDDFSGLVEVIPCESADSDTTAEALIWFKTRYLTRWPDYFISDQGSHFKNSLMRKLAQVVDASHRFTPTYHPCANGTVEVVNKSLRRVLSQLLIENNLCPHDWPYILPAVQSFLNDTPGSNGFAPKQVFMGLPLYDPLYVILAPALARRNIERMSVNEHTLNNHVRDLRSDLDNMHRMVEGRNVARRERNARHRDNALLRSSKNKHIDTTLFGRYQAEHGTGDDIYDKRYFYDSVNFHEGDFVLVAVPEGERHKQHKLMARWKGPFRITKAVSDHVYEVQHLIHRERKQEVHWSRLKFYCDDELEQIVKLREVVRREDQEESQVNNIIQHRYDAESLTHQFRIRWTGFTEDDDTWEDARYIHSLDQSQVNIFLNRMATGSRKKESLLDYLEIEE
jgi:transposase InsO family protein